jgi:hypothetical protein
MTDLMQRWENGPGYIFLESPDGQEELASYYLKDREAEGVKSVHFYFPNDLDAGKATNHMVIELAAFSAGSFTSRCRIQMAFVHSQLNVWGRQATNLGSSRRCKGARWRKEVLEWTHDLDQGTCFSRGRDALEDGFIATDSEDGA